MSPRRCAPLALVLAASIAGTAQAAVPAGPAGLRFYTPPAAKVAGPHGSVIWARPVRTGQIPSVGRTWLVLYRSTSPQGRTVPVSGLVTLPRRPAPRAGWPVVSWAHGTTGIADVCAPSRMLTTPRNVYTRALLAEMDGWLKRGYAVAQTDYQGLGTPGLHPYLIGTAEGRSVIDIVAAARRLNGHVGRRWVAIGHSQGGHAALWAAALGPRWAPGLRLAGAVPISPASHLGEQAEATRNLDSNPFGGLPALIVAGALTRLPADPASLLSDRVVALYPQVDRVCLGALGAQDSFGGIAIKDIVRPGVDPTPLYAVLSANDPETLTIRAPLLVAQGEADTTVFPMFTGQMVDALRARGTRVAYKTYPGVDHVHAPAAARADDDAFIRRLLG